MSDKLSRPQISRPMTSGGGAFLMIVGAALISAAFMPWSIGGQILIGGFILGALAIVAVSMIGRKRGMPKPPTRDIILVWVAVAVELAAFLIIMPLIPPDFRISMIVVIAIVGAHFLLMAWSFGPLIVALGLCCLGVAAAGQLVPSIPPAALIGIDGALKLAFGIAMFTALFRPRPASLPR